MGKAEKYFKIKDEAGSVFLCPLSALKRVEEAMIEGVLSDLRRLDSIIVNDVGAKARLATPPRTPGRNVAEVLRQLRALHHKQETDELMPCGWEPGKPTMPGRPESSDTSG